MKRLTRQDDWAGDYQVDDLDRRLQEIEAFYRTNRSLRELWDAFLLPTLRGKGAHNAVEIGSAPGWNLLEMARGLDVTPYGIEYTEDGVALNRHLFAVNGIDAENVRCEDFFSDAIDDWRGKFDIVSSFGFVEHFDDTVAVLRRHLDLCQPGGYIVVTIPKLHGPYYTWNKWFNPRVIETHNIDLMRGDTFFERFETIEGLEIIDRKIIGAFDYGLLTHRGQFVARLGISLLRRVDRLSQAIDRHVLTRLKLGLAPYMAVVGRKVG